MDEVKVSVIMTVYNAAKYLSESLDSALRQDLHEIEIVCVDGHSTDDTLQIISAYQANDERVHLYAQTRKGIGAAKNEGIEKAKGRYITFLDADDYYVDMSALRKMYEACERYHVKVCGAFRSTLYLDGHIGKEPLHRADCERNLDEGVKVFYADRPYDYHFHSYLYERRMIVESDARFAETLVYDDTHFFIRAMLQAKEFFVVPVELYRYRCGSGYRWDSEKTRDALKSFIDQLQITKKAHLDILHWLTVERINYEYEENFTRNIMSGDISLLEMLIKANEEISVNILDKVQEHPPSQSVYVDTMIHRRIEDMPLRRNEDNPLSPKYILEPLWKIIYLPDTHPEYVELEAKHREMEAKYQEMKAQYQEVEAKHREMETENREMAAAIASRSFRIGRAVTYIPRVIRAVLRSLYR